MIQANIERQQSLLSLLQAHYGTLQGRLVQERVARRLLAEPRVDLELYIILLKRSYPYVARTAPWLLEAAQRTEDLGLAKLLARKAEEEQGHEQWILADLEAMGCDVSAPERWLVVPAVVAYISWHDFAIQTLRPEAILGAAYILERLSENAGLLAQRLQIQGLPQGFASFMRGHAEADVGHVDELENALARLEGNVEVASQIRLSAEVTASAYIGLLRSIGE